MKNLKCHRCSCYLGEGEVETLKKGSVVLCDKCFEAYKILEDLSNYKKGISNINMPDGFDGFKDIFGMR